MNETLPPWRTFASSAADASPGEDQAQRPQGGQRQTGRWLALAVAAAGGAAGALAVAVVAGVLLTASLVEDPALAFGEPLDDALPLAASVDVDTTGALEILVDVAGGVVRPGLHRLRSGDRVGDAIEQAGGFAPRADLLAASQTLNLAQPLEDGAKVLVPELGVDRGGGPAGDDRIDLNRAGQAELETLPGVGPVTARRIIEARIDRRFASVRDLRSRGLVSEAVFEDLESLVRVG